MSQFPFKKLETLQEYSWGLPYVSKALTLLGFIENKVRSSSEVIWSHPVGLCCWYEDEQLVFFGLSLKGRLKNNKFFKHHKKIKGLVTYSFSTTTGLSVYDLDLKIASIEQLVDFAENNVLEKNILPFSEWTAKEFSCLWFPYNNGSRLIQISQNNLIASLVKGDALEKFQDSLEEDPTVNKIVVFLNQFFGKDWDVTKVEDRLFYKNTANFIRDEITWQECVEGFKGSKISVHPLMLILFSSLYWDDDFVEKFHPEIKVEQLIHEMVEVISAKELETIINKGVLTACLFNYICLSSNTSALHFLNYFMDVLKEFGKESVITSELFDFKGKSDESFRPLFLKDTLKQVDVLFRNHFELITAPKNGVNYLSEFLKMLDDSHHSNVLPLKGKIHSYVNERQLSQSTILLNSNNNNVKNRF